jgi:signal transduction histidine kinase
MNAIEKRKHTDLNQNKPYCEITVEDNGIGINEDATEKIFIMFQRLHHKNAYAGTGIGLARCKKVVTNHDGKIWAESKEGKGATFHILLPTR